LSASERGTCSTLEDLGSAGFMVELASIAHETQYTRLFRS
jgi:urease accessory protein